MTKSLSKSPRMPKHLGRGSSMEATQRGPIRQNDLHQGEA